MISAIIVYRNEENYILQCLDSLLKQDIGLDCMEVILVDGESTDAATQLAESFLKENAKVRYAIYHNPKRILATGWNIAIRAARGRYIVRPDAHAMLDKSYLSKGIRVLEDHPEVSAVGGQLDTYGDGFWGPIIATALSCCMGVGNSSFRRGGCPGLSDTAVFAIYRREIFDRVGYFNESLNRHQDNEMHSRIRKAGRRLWFQPDMKATYYCRNSVKSFNYQMYQNGFYLSDLCIGFHDGAIQARHLAPFAFWTLLTTLFVVGWSYYIPWIIGSITLLGYCIALIASGIYAALERRVLRILLLPMIIWQMHLCYASGTFVGLIKKCYHRVRLVSS